MQRYGGRNQLDMFKARRMRYGWSSMGKGRHIGSKGEAGNSTQKVFQV
jgi:hypothetical protein